MDENNLAIEGGSPALETEGGSSSLSIGQGLEDMTFANASVYEGNNEPNSPDGTEEESTDDNALDSSAGENGSTESQPETADSESAAEAGRAKEKDYETSAVMSKRINDINRKHEAEKAAMRREIQLAAEMLGVRPGESMEDVYIETLAHQRNVSPDVIRQERLRQQAELAAQVDNHPEVIAAREGNYKRMVDEDFQSIKNAFPDIKAESMDDMMADLGAASDKFLRLRVNGVDATTAYQAILTERARHTKPMPPAPPVPKTVTEERDYFTEAEMEKMDASEIADNPKLYERFRRSLAKITF